MDVIEMLYRWMLRILWIGHMSNDEVSKMLEPGGTHTLKFRAIAEIHGKYGTYKT